MLTCYTGTDYVLYKKKNINYFLVKNIKIIKAKTCVAFLVHTVIIIRARTCSSL